MKRTTGIAWYIFCLLVFAPLVEQAITYAPSVEHIARIVYLVTATLAAMAGITAVWLLVEQRRRPESWVFSPLASKIATFMAGIMTVIVLVAVVG